MTMEKYGVSPDIEHTELRDEEAQLMTKVATLMGDPGSAHELRSVERRLHEVRNRITRLDLGNSLQNLQPDLSGEERRMSKMQEETEM